MPNAANTVHDTPLTIAGEAFEPGTRRFWYLDAAETVTGPISVPVTVIAGSLPGKTLALTAACHPGEYSGVMASVRIATEVDPATLRGNIVIVHVQNVPGLQAKVGHGSPVDGVNMGRAYPVPGHTVEIAGNVSHQTSSPTHQIAARIFDEVILGADAHIDLHGGEFFEFVPPNIEYLLTGDDAVDERTRALARAFGFRVLWEVPQGSIPEMPEYPGRGSAVFEASMQGIPSVLCEVGGEGRVDEGLVDLTVAGILRVLESMEMLESAPAATEHEQITLIGGHVLFATRAGLFLSVVDPGEAVEAGQLLGRIIDLQGAEVEQLHAPQAGVLTNVVTRGIANPGDMLFVLGNLSRDGRS